MPDLIEGWRSVPISMRHVSHADDRTPDDHLIDGLHLIESELAKAGRELERSTFDEIAVQGRYLELKYSEDDRLP